MLRNSKKNITVSEHNSTLKFPKKGMQKTTFMMDKDKNAEAIKSPLRFVFSFSDCQFLLSISSHLHYVLYNLECLPCCFEQVVCRQQAHGIVRQ